MGYVPGYDINVDGDRESLKCKGNGRKEWNGSDSIFLFRWVLAGSARLPVEEKDNEHKIENENENEKPGGRGIQNLIMMGWNETCRGISTNMGGWVCLGI